MCNNGTWDVMTKWLGDMKRVVDPVRVTYVRNPLMDDPGAGLVGNRAYWLSGIETRDRALGTIDVVSGGFDTGPAAAEPQGDREPLHHKRRHLPRQRLRPARPPLRPARRTPTRGSTATRGPARAQTPTDTLTITAKNIGSLVIDPQRAKVSCDAKLDVTTDGPLSITLLGCGGGPQTFG